MRHYHFVHTAISVIAICLFVMSAAFAQETTGTINGTVTDANGAVVANAKVTSTDVEKKVVVRTVNTNDEGLYSVPNLGVGLYDVTIEMTGFKKHLANNVKLDVGQRRTIDVTLATGDVTETVTVTAQPVAVEVTSPTASTVINGQQLRELQINNRNFEQLVTLAPGVTNDLDDTVFTGTNNPETQVVNRALISVNGARSTQNTFTVDGADITDRGANLTIQTYPNIDSIGEFKVLRSLYPAESGRSGGGQINVITRSGSDKFHGSLFEFVRNERLNANDFQTNRTPTLASSLGRDDNGKIKRRPFRYNNYGFTVGGPVYFFNFGEGNGSPFPRLKRPFFFFSEEQRKNIRYPTLSTRNAGGAAPTPPMKQGIFPIPICLSASSSTTCTSILPAGTPIGSVVPLSNVAQQYVNLIWNRIPDPTSPATLQLDFPTLNQANFRQEIIRIDHSPNDKLSMFFRYEHDKIPTIDADGSIGGRSNLPFVNRMVSDSPGRAHTFQAIYSVNPNVIVEGRYTYGYGAIFTHTIGLISKEVSPITVPLPYTSVRDVVPVLSVSGFNSLTGFSNYIDPSWKRSVTGTLTWVRGNHTMKYGALYTYAAKTENALSGTNQGSFSAFSNTVTSVASPACVRATGVTATGVNTLYQNWACFLMGKNVTFTQSKLDLMINFRQNNYEAFAQDEWRMRRNVTLSYGVRYSYFGPLYDRNSKLLKG